MKGVAEAWKAAQPRTGTDGTGAEGVEGKQVREKENAVCFDEGADYEGCALESPAAGGGSFSDTSLSTVIFCGVSQCFAGIPMVTSETVQTQCKHMADVKLEYMNAFSTAWLFL